MNYSIRQMKECEYILLNDFLYEAIFKRDGQTQVPRDIIKKPELQVYVKDFGMYKDDFCLCAEVDEKVIGAVWVRNINGYGSIDCDTPELAISLYKNYRGHGIGTDMMNQMVNNLRNRGYKKASLAVQKDNYAFYMYKNIGFKVIGENAEEYIMEVRI